jgi:hypothetical protein
MAVEQNLESITLVADSSIGIYTGVPLQPGSPDPHYGKQYCFVKVTGAMTAGLAVTKATDVVVGVLQNKPQGTGHAATVAVHGVSMVQSGEDIAAGDSVAFDTTGRAITYTGTGDQLVGVALTGCAAQNQLVSVLLKL